MKIDINQKIDSELKAMKVRKENLEKTMMLLREGAYVENEILHIRTCSGCLSNQLSQEASQYSVSKPSEHLKILLKILGVEKLVVHGLSDYKIFEHVDEVEHFGCDTAFHCDVMETVFER